MHPFAHQTQVFYNVYTIVQGFLYEVLFGQLAAVIDSEGLQQATIMATDGVWLL